MEIIFIVLLIMLAIVFGLPLILFLTKTSWRLILHHHAVELLKELEQVIRAYLDRFPGGDEIKEQIRKEGLRAVFQRHAQGLGGELKHSILGYLKRVPGVKVSPPSEQAGGPTGGAVPITSATQLAERKRQHEVRRDFFLSMLFGVALIAGELAFQKWWERRKERKEGREAVAGTTSERKWKWWRWKRREKPVEARVISPLPLTSEVSPTALALPVLADEIPESPARNKTPRASFFERINIFRRLKEWRERRRERIINYLCVFLVMIIIAAFGPIVEKWFPDHSRLALALFILATIIIVGGLNKWRWIREETLARKEKCPANFATPAYDFNLSSRVTKHNSSQNLEFCQVLATPPRLSRKVST